LLVNAKKRKCPFLRLAQQQRRKLEKELAPASTPVAPASTPVTPTSSQSTFWWQEYTREEVLAFDTEMVTLLEKKDGKHVNRPATVALVNYDGIVVYSVIIMLI
jgi:hypothetical protein